MSVTAELLWNLERKLERRTLRFRQASQYMAQFNAFSHSRTEDFDERLRRNFENARQRLTAAQDELRELLSSSSSVLIHSSDQTEGGSQLILEAHEGLLSFLAKNPNYLYDIHSRTFEELVARIFEDLGCSVELMRATHDGGKDLIVRTEGPMGLSIAYVQCKRYSPLHAVGIETVRQLYGIQTADNINKSMIVTTSHFSDEAIELSRRLAFLISLKDYSDVVSWLNRYR